MWKLATFLILLPSIALGAIPKINLPISLRWDDQRQSLFFGNLMPQGSEYVIYRYDTKINKLFGAKIEGVGSVSFIVDIVEHLGKSKNQYAIGTDKEIKIIEWDGLSNYAKVVKNLATLDANIPSSAIDTARVDPLGRLYTGTLSLGFCNGLAAGLESVYNFDRKNGLKRLFGNSTMTVGIAFNYITRTMYHLNPCSFVITEYNWDEFTGDVYNPRVVFDFHSISGYQLQFNAPLGLEIDTTGLLYTCLQSGSILIINPKTKTVVRTVKVPVPGLTGLIFGGPKKTTLFVLAARTIIDFTKGPNAFRTFPDGSSIYAIEGLCKQSFDQPRFDVECTM